MRVKFFTGYLLVAIIALAWVAGRITSQLGFSVKAISEFNHYSHLLMLILIVIVIMHQLFKNRSSHSHDRIW